MGVEPKIGVGFSPPKSSILIGFGTIINHTFEVFIAEENHFWGSWPIFRGKLSC